MKKTLFAILFGATCSLLSPSLMGSNFPINNEPNPGLSSASLKRQLAYFFKDDSPLLAALYSASDLNPSTNNNSPAALTKEEIMDRASVIAGINDAPGKNVLPSIFSIFGGGSSTYTPFALYTHLQKQQALNQFVSYDRIYNPLMPPKSVVNTDSVNYFSLNSIFTSKEALQHFKSLMNTAVPQSLQNHHIQLAGSHKSELEKHKKISFYDGNALKPTYSGMQDYQNQRRRMIAFQMAAMNNLQTLQKMSQTLASEKKNKTLDDLLLMDVKAVGSMTSVQVARMSLLTQVLILKEIRKQRQIHQLMLGTLSLMLAQGNNASSSMLNMSFKKATEELDAAYGIKQKTKMPKVPKS